LSPLHFPNPEVVDECDNNIDAKSVHTTSARNDTVIIGTTISDSAPEPGPSIQDAESVAEVQNDTIPLTFDNWIVEEPADTDFEEFRPGKYRKLAGEAGYNYHSAVLSEHPAEVEETMHTCKNANSRHSSSASTIRHLPYLCGKGPHYYPPSESPQCHARR